MKSPVAALPLALVSGSLAILPAWASGSEADPRLVDVVIENTSLTTTVEVAGIVTVAPTAAAPLDRRGLSVPALTDASSYLSYVYAGAAPTSATGIVATLAASALYALETAFEAQPQAPARDAALLSAAAAAGINVAALRQSGYNWASIQTQPWYSAGMPSEYQAQISSFVDSWYQAGSAVLEGIPIIPTGLPTPTLLGKSDVAGTVIGTITVLPSLTTITQAATVSIGPAPSTASWLYIWPETTIVAASEAPRVKGGIAGPVIAVVVASLVAAWALVN